MAVGLHDELRALLERNSVETARGALDVLLTLVSNVLRAPEDAKFRQLKLSNKVIEGKLASADGGLRLLTSLGFVETEPGIMMLPMEADLGALSHAHRAIADAIHAAEPQMLVAPGASATGARVELLIYDLSAGAARSLATSLLGIELEIIPHTGIAIFGSEYYFSGGVQVEAIGAFSARSNLPVHKSIELGHTEVPREVFDEFCEELGRERFHAEAYNLLENNCNHFSNVCAEFLLGARVPDDILDVPRRVLSTPRGQMLRPMLEAMGRPLNDSLQGAVVQDNEAQRAQTGVPSGSALPTNSSLPFSAFDVQAALAPLANTASDPTPATPIAAALASSLLAATPATAMPTEVAAAVASNGARSVTPATADTPRTSDQEPPALHTPAPAREGDAGVSDPSGASSTFPIGTSRPSQLPSSYRTPMAGGPLARASRPLLSCDGDTSIIGTRLISAAQATAADESEQLSLTRLSDHLTTSSEGVARLHTSEMETLGQLFARLIPSLRGTDLFVLLFVSRLLVPERAFARAWLHGGAIQSLVELFHLTNGAISAGAKVMGLLCVSNLIATAEGLQSLGHDVPRDVASNLVKLSLESAAQAGDANTKEAQAAAALIQNLAISLREVALCGPPVKNAHEATVDTEGQMTGISNELSILDSMRLQLLDGLTHTISVQDDAEALKRLLVALGSLVAQMLDASEWLARPLKFSSSETSQMLSRVLDSKCVTGAPQEVDAIVKEIRGMVKRL